MSYQSIKVFEILSLSQKLKKRSLYWKRGWRRYTLLSAFVRLWFMMKLVSNVCPYLLLSFYPLSFPVQSSSLPVSKNIIIEIDLFYFLNSISFRLITQRPPSVMGAPTRAWCQGLCIPCPANFASTKGEGILERDVPPPQIVFQESWRTPLSQKTHKKICA